MIVKVNYFASYKYKNTFTLPSFEASFTFLKDLKKISIDTHIHVCVCVSMDKSWKTSDKILRRDSLRLQRYGVHMRGRMWGLYDLSFRQFINEMVRKLQDHTVSGST